ncbi:MAG: HAD family phosphatase [Clostridia bacterium]|nr:HAD family phosphatase [Clostridia bacterium]
MIRAILFDMDGLLFDTESSAGIMLNAATQRQGITLTEAQWKQMLSKSLDTINGMLKDWYGDAIDTDRFADDWFLVTLDYMRQNGMPVMPGAEALLPALKARGLKLAICTSNNDRVVKEYLALAGWEQFFDVIVASDELSRPKPDPEVFLKAAAKLGVAPCECVGVEDSVNGVKAIRAAGMISVMVPDVFPYTDDLAPYVDHCLNSLCEFEQTIFDKE